MLHVRDRPLLRTACVAGALLCVAYGFAQGPTESRVLRERLQATRQAHETHVHFEDLDALPGPVMRYFHRALRDGQPVITATRLEQVGALASTPAALHWRSFTAEQVVLGRRPGFDWNARVRLLPGLFVRVHNSLVAGHPFIHAVLLGVLSLPLKGSVEPVHGGLLRFLIEAPWYPTALLPSQGVEWRAVDEQSALATLRDGDTLASVLFTFDERGLIASARAAGEAVETSQRVWQGQYSNYVMRGGMRIPLDCVVAWTTQAPFWRAHVTTIAFELPH